MKQLLVTLLLLSLTFLHAVAQIDAKGILDRTTEAFGKAGGIKASFTVYVGNDPLSSGEICLRGKKFVLETNGVTTWFDGRTQWTYMASADEVTITEPTAEELQAINPYAYLALHTQGYRLEPEATATDAKVYNILFTAQRIQEPRAIAFAIDKQTFLPVRVTLEQRNGDILKIVITSCQIHQSYPDSCFVFDAKKYPQAEEIDLR